MTHLCLFHKGGRYSHPIYSKEGGWPASVIRIMKEASFKEGYEVSRLPDFSDEEIKLIRGMSGIFGIKYSQQVLTYFELTIKPRCYSAWDRMFCTISDIL